MRVWRRWRRARFVHKRLEFLRFLRRIGRNPSPHQWAWFTESAEREALRRWPA